MGNGFEKGGLSKRGSIWEVEALLQTRANEVRLLSRRCSVFLSKIKRQK